MRLKREYLPRQTSIIPRCEQKINMKANRESALLLLSLGAQKRDLMNILWTTQQLRTNMNERGVWRPHKRLPKCVILVYYSAHALLQAFEKRESTLIGNKYCEFLLLLLLPLEKFLLLGSIICNFVCSSNYLNNCGCCSFFRIFKLPMFGYENVWCRPSPSAEEVSTAKTA